jgi:hypothetical protein
MATVSETLFEAFCSAREVEYERVPEATESRPDYWVVAGRLRVVVEVKQIDPNPDDIRSMDLHAQGKAAAMGGAPGERIRKALRAANRQIRKLADGCDAPGVVVLFNNTPCHLYTAPYAVMTAMRGLDVVSVNLSADGGPGAFGAARPGPKSEMRPGVNCSTSAIAVLSGAAPEDSSVPGDRLALDVYHNRHARVAIDPDFMRWDLVRHFSLPSDSHGSCDTVWEET